MNPPTAADIDVRYEPAHEAFALQDDRPMLTWQRHPEHGYGWILWYLEDPDSPTSGVDAYFIPGDLTEVDAAVRSALHRLSMVYGREGRES
jgi:hypothetical protein